MDGQLTVELADLRGWADQVGRAGGDCDYLAGYLATFVPDGDFGRLLALVTPGYESVALRVREALEVDGARLDRTRDGLCHAAARYESADARAAERFGHRPAAGAAVAHDGRSRSAFRDGAASTPISPVCGGEVLPEVTFGWALDQACELVSGLGGPDIRRDLTDLVVGDIAKASAQGSAWEHAGDALAAVRGNLVRGGAAVATTWEGLAATSARIYARAWCTALGNQSGTMAQLAEYLRDLVAQAVDVAQLVVDAVKEIVSIVCAGWSLASIPIYGQVQLVDKVGDAVKLACQARSVLLVFWNFLLVVKDAFVVAADCFTAESLPPAPHVPAGVRA